MLGQNDKLTLTVVNARDIEGKILPFQLKLPLNNDEYILPKEVVSMDVIEYHEGLVNSGAVPFSIYIGEPTTISNIISEFNNDVRVSKNIEIESIDTPVCIQNILDKKVIIATIKEQDIVVENQEQLISVFEQISNNLRIINNSVANIKGIYKKYTKRYKNI